MASRCASSAGLSGGDGGARRKRQALHRYADLFGGQAALVRGEVAGLDLLVLDAPHLYRPAGQSLCRPDGTDWPDNCAALRRAWPGRRRLRTGRRPGYRAGVVHAHDWQAALTPAYLRYRPRPRLPTVMTIHNLAFQGQFPATSFRSLGLPPAAFAIDGVEYYGGVGFLKAGLQFADGITTVSPTYARGDPHARRRHGPRRPARARADRSDGIVNGIDTDGLESRRPTQHLAAHLCARRLPPRGQQGADRAALRLEPDDGPLFCVVSRLTWQKGMDILAR